MLSIHWSNKENKRKNWFEALQSELLFDNKSSDTIDKLNNFCH